MKWFKELVIWRSIDSSKPEQRGTCQTLEWLHKRLQTERPGVRIPGDLHQGIMSQVRSARNLKMLKAPQVEVARIWSFGRAAAGFGLVLLLGLVVVSLNQRSDESTTSALAAKPNLISVHSPAALAELPFSVLTPLEEEWRRVNQDMTNAASTLLSSVP